MAQREGDGISYVDPRTLLQENALFRILDPASLEEVLHSLRKVTYLRSQVIFKEAEAADAMFVVASGRVGVIKHVSPQKESIVALMERGDLLGEMGLFDAQSRSATARALERTELLRIPYTAFRAALGRRPQLLWGMVELLASRLKSTDDALADAMFLDVSGRTAKRLLELSSGKDEFYLPLTQEELAGLIGASRERVNKALSTLIKGELLSVKDHTYRILNREKLETIAR
jgi:CRP-like cAMP-binding protein